MSGHDYYGEGVSKAVDEHVKKFKREVHIDESFDPCKIYWWRMPSHSFSVRRRKGLK